MCVSNTYAISFEGVATNHLSQCSNCVFFLHFLAGEMFLIVDYIISDHETEVEVVPSSWYSSGQCWWPPDAFARSTLEKKVVKSVDCDKATWDCYEARLIATFSTYLIYYYTLIDVLKSF